MSKLVGGLFSAPSGHNNGLIFGKGRTKDGKKVTVRAYTKPTNPNTNAQQTQRSKFRYAQQIASSLVPQLNSLGWDRAVAQLPAYQSLVSIFSQNIEMPSGDLTQPDIVSLGNLHVPDDFTVTYDGTAASITWSAELGANGNSDDIAHILFMPASPGLGEPAYSAQALTGAIRNDGTFDITSTRPQNNPTLYALWFENSAEIDQGASEWSKVKWFLLPPVTP